MFKIIEPEVAGGFGDESELDTTVHPPIVYKLHYEFQGWLLNDILESFPCFIVTENLKEAILKIGLAGVEFDFVKISTSYVFKQLYPEKVLPKFSWMKIFGEAGKHDFGISDKFRLVISEKAYDLLSLFNISAADIKDYI
jgi:hypothetical protein